MKYNITPKDKLLNENIKNPKAGQVREIKAPRKITEKYLYNSGLAYLQRFPSSTANFRTVMGRKIKKSVSHHEEPTYDECAKMLDETVHKFTRMGLLDDGAYLKGMVESLKKRGLSKNSILQKLQQKGLGNTDITLALKNYEDYYKTTYDHELIACLRLIRRKRLGPFRTKENFDFNKELAAIARAGYSFEIAQKGLKCNQEDAEEILQEMSF